MNWHLDLTEAESLVSLQSKYDGVIRRLISGLGASKSTELATNFRELTQSLRLSSANSWVSELVRRQVSGDARMRRVNTTVFEFIRDVRAFLKAYHSFVARPVQMSSDLVDAPQAIQILHALTEGKKPFGLFSFAAKQFQERFSAIRIAGKAPVTTEDWEYVKQYARLRSELSPLRTRWHAVRDQLEIPSSVDFAEESVPQLEALLSLLESAVSELPTRISRLQASLVDVLKTREDAAEVMADESSIIDFSEAFSRTTRAARLGETKQKLESLTAKLDENVQFCRDASAFIKGALGMRRGKSKINPREAEVIVEEIEAIISNPLLATIPGTVQARSIGVISLIGGFQAAYIQKLLLDRVGEAVIVRHRIICGDSATMQGNERDIVFLSMVADRKSRHAQTSEQYAQRFNVALSRARDRMILVRSVEPDNLNPKDLKAKVIQHFRDPMPATANRSSKLIELCDSGFERAVFTKLTEAGYRVTPQVGSEGFFIDMVVEGEGGRRLAIECDGDRYHGPERWADDMRRQRILERVGWTFWRCFGSDYMIDTEGVFSDLVATMEARGIKPIGSTDEVYTFTEHRMVGGDVEIQTENEDYPNAADENNEIAKALQSLAPTSPLEVGDRIILRFLDRENAKPEFFEVVEGQSDESNGLLGLSSTLAIALSRAEPEDEITVQLEGETRRLMFVALESAEKEAA